MKKSMPNTNPNFVFMSGHVDAINPDCTDRRYTILTKNESKVRRPDVARLAAQLQAQNPKLSDLAALVRAKATITSKKA